MLLLNDSTPYKDQENEENMQTKKLPTPMNNEKTTKEQGQQCQRPEPRCLRSHRIGEKP